MNIKPGFWTNRSIIAIKKINDSKIQIEQCKNSSVKKKRKEIMKKIFTSPLLSGNSREIKWDLLYRGNASWAASLYTLSSFKTDFKSAKTAINLITFGPKKKEGIHPEIVKYSIAWYRNETFSYILDFTGGGVEKEPFGDLFLLLVAKLRVIVFLFRHCCLPSLVSIHRRRNGSYRIQIWKGITERGSGVWSVKASFGGVSASIDVG